MRIGIIGAGQLGRMMALSGIPLGLEFAMYDQSGDVPGAAVAPIVTGRFDDLGKLARFAKGVDVVTFDWENVPVASVRAIAKRVPVWPPPRALAASQDRWLEKQLFRRLGIPVAPTVPVDTREQLTLAMVALGLPGILKTRRLGYDGKGQALLRRPADAERAWRALGGASLVYEQFVPFTRELSLIGARDRRGRVAFYPLAENRHENGILAETRAPYRNAALQRAAERHHRRLMHALGYVGVLCVEYFVLRGRLVANEMAPRVHNSGHWTMDACLISQFENHMRAVAGWPLGPAERHSDVTMTNLIGPDADGWQVLAAEPGTAVHLYGKPEARPGRKMGHVNRLRPKS